METKELQAKRTKCEIYTRVMGYFRPVSQFNIGKKSEFYERTCFNQETSMNSKFLKEYAVKEEDKVQEEVNSFKPTSEILLTPTFA